MNLARRQRLYEVVLAAKALGCRICQERDPVALDFHHLDPSAKDLHLGGMMSNGYNADRLIAEIQKCVVVCANCHRKLHAGHISL